jgi:hypothetical protein
MGGETHLRSLGSLSATRLFGGDDLEARRPQAWL